MKQTKLVVVSLLSFFSPFFLSLSLPLSPSLSLHATWIVLQSNYKQNYGCSFIIVFSSCSLFLPLSLFTLLESCWHFHWLTQKRHRSFISSLFIFYPLLSWSKNEASKSDWLFFRCAETKSNSWRTWPE